MRRRFGGFEHSRRGAFEDIYGRGCATYVPTFNPQTVITGQGQPFTVEMAQVMGRVFAQENAAEIQQVMVALGEVDKVDGIPIGKGFTGITVDIGTTATPIVTPDTKRAYLIINPASETLGQTTSDTIASASTVTASTNSSDIDVAGAEDLHVIFDPTAITGRWQLWLQIKDPVSGTKYANTQLLFDTDDTDITAGGGPYYAYVGSHGIGDTCRFALVEASAGSLTYSLGITRKKNVGESDISSGVPRTVYLGNSGVSTVSGYPLLSGNQEFFIIDQGVDLHGVAQAATTIKMFQLEG